MEQDKNKLKTHYKKFDITIIPFNYRKTSLLSISFRSFDLEMGQFKIKIESDGESNLKSPIISRLSETTLVSIIYNYNIIFNRYQNFKLIITIKNLII